MDGANDEIFVSDADCRSAIRFGTTWVNAYPRKDGSVRYGYPWQNYKAAVAHSGGYRIVVRPREARK